MEQLSTNNIGRPSAKRINIYANITIAFAIGLATLMPVKKPWRACDTAEEQLDA